MGKPAFRGLRPGEQREDGEHELATPAPRFAHQPVKPFESEPAHKGRREPRRAGPVIERATDTEGDPDTGCRECIAVSLDPEDLPGGTVGDGDDSRA